MDEAGFVAFRRSIARGCAFLARSKGWKLGVAGLAASLLMLQLLLVTFAGARIAASAALERGAVHVEVSPGTPDQRVQELYAALRTLPSASRVTFVTGEKMLEEEGARDASLADFLDRYGMDNPFSDAFVVVPRDMRAYADVRAFVEREKDRGGVDAAAFSEIAAKETSAEESLGALRTVETGVALLLLLSAITSAVLSLGILGRIAETRTAGAKGEKLAGAADGIIAMPATVAGMVALLGSLCISIAAAAILVPLLALWPASSAVAWWLSHAAWTGALPSAPAIVTVEALALAGLAYVVSRGGSKFRF